jgi:transcriptional regulator with XRE-family HTH domain
MKIIELNLNFDEIRKRIELDKAHYKVGKWAEFTGMSISSISNIHGKKGRVKPSIEYVIAVAKFTGKPIEWYLYGTEADKISEPQAEYNTASMAGWTDIQKDAFHILKEIFESKDDDIISAISSNLNMFKKYYKHDETKLLPISTPQTLEDKIKLLNDMVEEKDKRIASIEESKELLKKDARRLEEENKKLKDNWRGEERRSVVK